MNYNSIEEILSAGTTNMEVLRNNTKNDDSTDTITGVSWFTYKNIVASTIYASGNSWIGFGSSSEHLRVNRRDGALYSLYREEGTLYNYYKFLKIRWKGYSYYNKTTSAYAIEYDVILWDTGDISLHMISIPTSYNTGTYSLTESSTYSYKVSTSQPDITFKKTDSGFEVSNSIINLELPYERRCLLRSGSTYYTVTDNILTEITVPELTSEIFLASGTNAIPSFSLLAELDNPEILYWQDSDEALEKGLIIKGTPSLPQFVYYDIHDISEYNGIEKIEVRSNGDALFSVSFDDEQTWKYYDNESWIIATSDSEGMTAKTMSSVPASAWAEVVTSTSFRARCALLTLDSNVSKLYIKYN